MLKKKFPSGTTTLEDFDLTLSKEQIKAKISECKIRIHEYKKCILHEKKRIEDLKILLDSADFNTNLDDTVFDKYGTLDLKKTLDKITLNDVRDSIAKEEI